MAFALGWTPCIGPVLATILFYAGSDRNGRAGRLPPADLFAWPRAAVRADRSRLESSLGLAELGETPQSGANLASAALLVSFGLLFFSNRVFYLNLFAQRLYYELLR